MYAGSILKQIRLSLELGQDEISKIFSISQSYYSAIENGKKPLSDKLRHLYHEKFGIIIHKDISKDSNGDVFEKYGGFGVDLNGGIDEKYHNSLIELKNQAESRNAILVGGSLRDQLIQKVVMDNTGMPTMLDLNITKKLILDIKGLDNNITRVSNSIHEVTAFENIIESIEYAYFSGIIEAQSNKVKYYDGKKFDYLSYKRDVIKEYEKCLKFLPSLEKLAKAIEEFYNDFQQVDDKNIVNGFFGRE